jgi:hypothetical protein
MSHSAAWYSRGESKVPNAGGRSRGSSTSEVSRHPARTCENSTDTQTIASSRHITTTAHPHLHDYLGTTLWKTCVELRCAALHQPACSATYT